MTRIPVYTEVRCEFGGPDPGDPVPGEMQVFYENDVPMMVDFICPCGCGRAAPIHLKPEENGKQDRLWVFKRGPSGGVMLSPSIRWTGGCYAHFYIKDGKSEFCNDSGVKPKV